MWVVDAITEQLWMLMQSDAGGAPVEDLTTGTGLWVRNGLVHFAAGFIFFFVEVHCPKVSPAHVRGAFIFYCLLQVVQVGTAYAPGAALIDGLVDMALPLLGWALALTMVARGVKP
ncbi:MAG: hypothetical protein CSA72_10490 [Rhodobacterales bacterium]|nr:MAG: hypothetical protein CSA72_10490 [Rhodobacterales bacterium]